MHAHVIQVFIIWSLVFDCCKSRQAIFVEVQAKWIDTNNKDIKSEIKFKAINQKWFSHIPLNNHPFFLPKLILNYYFFSCQQFRISGQENPFALA
jgi:hypothetical protein